MFNVFTQEKECSIAGEQLSRISPSLKLPIGKQFLFGVLFGLAVLPCLVVKTSVCN